MPGSIFPTTRRSVVAALASEDAAERSRAFETLAAIYWKPLYKYARFALSRGAADAEDLTQDFLARSFERNSLSTYDPSTASFRTFLRTLFDRHAANETRAATRQKRGGGLDRVDAASAEEELARDSESTVASDEYFQREWVRSVFSLAIDRVRRSIDPQTFAILEAYDLDSDDRVTYRALGQRFGLPETTVTNRLATARRAFRETVLELLREITVSDHEFRREARALLGVDV